MDLNDLAELSLKTRQQLLEHFFSDRDQSQIQLITGRLNHWTSKGILQAVGGSGKGKKRLYPLTESVLFAILSEFVDVLNLTQKQVELSAELIRQSLSNLDCEPNQPIWAVISRKPKGQILCDVCCGESSTISCHSDDGASAGLWLDVTKFTKDLANDQTD